MSILINKNTRLIVQGITGRDGGFHATKMKAYGTNVVGGTSPGKAGQEVNGIPVFNTVKDAVEATQANTSVIFVPAAFAKDAMMEAADAGIQLIICITEGVPTLDVVQAYNYIQQKGAKLIGPNCPGLISPEESMVGIMPTNIFKKGGTGVISRSGTLTYEWCTTSPKRAWDKALLWALAETPSWDFTSKTYSKCSKTTPKRIALPSLARLAETPKKELPNTSRLT